MLSLRDGYFMLQGSASNHENPFSGEDKKGEEDGKA
jgi:hypothetical protein